VLFIAAWNEPARLWRMVLAPERFALKWFCPGARATILPFLLTRRRFENDLLFFMEKPHIGGPAQYA